MLSKHDKLTIICFAHLRQRARKSCSSRKVGIKRRNVNNKGYYLRQLKMERNLCYRHHYSLLIFVEQPLVCEVHLLLHGEYLL